jgi:hypothetical protein
MEYLLMIYSDEADWDLRSDQEKEALMSAYGEFATWLEKQGWMRGGARLYPTSQSTTVRVRDGKTLSTDGPFAETKEQLGGYFVIECDNLDQAIEAASRIPAAAHGSVEVRPLDQM